MIRRRWHRLWLRYGFRLWAAQSSYLRWVKEMFAARTKAHGYARRLTAAAWVGWRRAIQRCDAPPS